MIFSISYDLHQPGQKYQAVHERIKSLGSSWCHPLESTWLVDTHLDAEGIYSALKPILDDNDRILIMRVTRPYTGYLSQQIWDWINQRL